MIFIGGTGRSGTSIVKEILATHSDAASIPFEYRFIIDPDGLIDFYSSLSNSWSPFLADLRLKRLERLLHNLAREPWYHQLLGRLLRWCNRDGKIFSPRRYHGWELNRHLPNFEHHVNDLMSQLVEFTFPARWVGTESYQRFPRIYHMSPKSKQELARILGKFVRNVVDELMQRDGKEFFVEDNTWNILFAKQILELLPDSKIIHVYRDPRDVVASFSLQRWSPTDKELGARWYKTMMDHWFNVRSSLPTAKFFELKLEDLVAHPEEMLRELCEFVEIAFESSMLQIDLGHSHRGRWKLEYSRNEKIKVLTILSTVIQELGYEEN